MMRLARWGLLCAVLLALPAWSMSTNSLKTASDRAGMRQRPDRTPLPQTGATIAVTRSMNQ